MNSRPHQLRRRIQWLTWFFIVGLVISGATAMPLVTELTWLTDWTHAATLAQTATPPAWAVWLVKVHHALQDVGSTYPFVFYGNDWLAFGHFMIALAYAGPLRDPVRNRWLYLFGLIACGLVIPYAFVLGAVRGIPIWWRLIDCSFGVVGFVPLWFCWKWSGELEADTVVEHSEETSRQGREARKGNDALELGSKSPIE